MVTTKMPKEFFTQLAEKSAWEIAEVYQCSYDGDSNPINHGGFFYNPNTWEKYGYVNAIEFWYDSEHDCLVVQKGTVNKPSSTKEWNEIWRQAPKDEDKTNVNTQVSYSRSLLGMEPEGTQYPALKDFNLNEWQEWRIWRSIHNWLTELGQY